MRLVLITFFSLLFSLSLMASGNAYLLTLVGINLGLQKIEPTKIGYIMTAYSLGFALGAMFASKLLKRVGHIRAFAALASITGMAAIAFPLSNSLLLWSIFRLFGGFSIAGLYIAIESWLNTAASDANRARLFALYQVLVYLATAMGQLLISSGVPPQSPISFIIAGLLLMAAVIPLSVSRLQTPPFENAPAMSVFALWRRVPLGVFAAFAGGVLIHSFYALVPLYGALTELSTDRIAQLMSLSVLTAMAWAWPIGWLCDRVLRSNVLIGISILVVLMALVASLLGRADFWILVIAGSVIMACIAAMYSVGVAITNDIVSQEERIGASAALMFAYGAGSVMGPLGGSWLMEYIGPSALFLGFAAVGAFLAIYTYYRQLMLPPVDLEEQEEFVVSSPEASVNVELDPRTDELTASSIEDLFPENMLEDKNTPS